MKKLGTWWNDKTIEIYKIEEKNIALNGWNGEKYLHCFEVDDSLLTVINQDIELEAIPKYKDTQIIDFELIVS